MSSYICRNSQILIACRLFDCARVYRSESSRSRALVIGARRRRCQGPLSAYSPRLHGQDSQLTCTAMSDGALSIGRCCCREDLLGNWPCSSLIRATAHLLPNRITNSDIHTIKTRSPLGPKEHGIDDQLSRRSDLRARSEAIGGPRISTNLGANGDCHTPHSPTLPVPELYGPGSMS